MFPQAAVSFAGSNVAKVLEVSANIFLVALFNDCDLYILDITDNSIFPVNRNPAHKREKSISCEFFKMEFTKDFILYRNDK